MKSRTWARAFLRHALVRERLPLDGDTYWLALHDKAPGEDQQEAETGYEGYARVALPLSPEMWRIVDGDADADVPVTAENLQLIRMPLCTGGPELEISHWTIGLAQAGPGDVRFKGEFDTPFTIKPNRRPEFEPGDLKLEEF